MVFEALGDHPDSRSVVHLWCDKFLKTSLVLYQGNVSQRQRFLKFRYEFRRILVDDSLINPTICEHSSDVVLYLGFVHLWSIVYFCLFPTWACILFRLTVLFCGVFCSFGIFFFRIFSRLGSVCRARVFERYELFSFWTPAHFSVS